MVPENYHLIQQPDIVRVNFYVTGTPKNEQKLSLYIYIYIYIYIYLYGNTLTLVEWFAAKPDHTFTNGRLVKRTERCLLKWERLIVFLPKLIDITTSILSFVDLKYQLSLVNPSIVDTSFVMVPLS